ncbi:coiled-coil domain containing 163 [Elysia marginata]|uniref:Coiled-coil domain containing 163 n=1 Tax=Elysia marginata TaxID=1093978 RepID=A0AAV4G7N5_9GAST|nr:coiled-coil domain containing 163 [Elysia marginata]
MDWQNKFYSIVRETEENLSKAKLKLAAKNAGLSNSLRDQASPRQAVSTAPAFTHSVGGLPSFFSKSQQSGARTLALYMTPAEEFTMSAASGIQVLHMQEQIDAQNRTIDQLQKLVQSLDRERDFYKLQISHLQEEIDNLSDKMRRQMTLAGNGNERQMSRIKQEVIHEIDKVKTMLSNRSRSPRAFSSQASPLLDDELWNVKENLTESLDHIRRELRLMNKRIDRMESGIPKDTVTKHESFSQSQYQRSPRNNKPSYTTTIDSALDVNQLRSTINMLNTKLDSLENRLDVSSQPKPPLYSQIYSASSVPYVPTSSFSGPFLPSTNRYDDGSVDDDVSSISGLSDLSNLSDAVGDDDNDELDDEIEAIIRRSSSSTHDNKCKSAIKSSIYKADSRKKGKVEFDLSDLDLSDIEAADDDSLDL